MFTVTVVSEITTSVVTADCVRIPSLTAPVLVKKRLVPLYSNAPFSAIVRFVPDVNFKGAVEAVAVPAFKCKIAVGAVTPNPNSPVLKILARSTAVVHKLK